MNKLNLKAAKKGFGLYYNGTKVGYIAYDIYSEELFEARKEGFYAGLNILINNHFKNETIGDYKRNEKVVGRK